MEHGADGIRAETVDTARLRMHYRATGDPADPPVVLIHGNLSTAAFFDEVLAAAPDRFFVVAPDMRGFGRTEAAPIDATRGLRDWSDDLAALVAALGIARPCHLLGWSTGGGAVLQYTIDRPDAVASLTLLNPVSPYGYGATSDEVGTPTSDDHAGSGAGLANPEFVQRLRDGDASADSQSSPRNVMRAFYWHPEHRVAPEREDVLVDEMLRSQIGETGYPGDAVPSDNWPGVAPGRTGILNALSPGYFDVSGIVDVDPKPPILWLRGDGDQVVSDEASLDAGTLGKLEILPGWPGADAHPPQPMLRQTRQVLDRYAAAGGTVREEVIARSSHGPVIDQVDTCAGLLYGFVSEVEHG